TDPKAEPRHRGMSCFIVEKGHPGLRVAKSIAKLGYKGVDTAELVFEEFVVPAANLVGGIEGRGFKHVMSGLETGRINIAARAVGVAQATWDDTLAHARATDAAPDPRLADMAGQLHGARLITYWAAGMKDRGERCDLEAGMAKLHASETAQTLAETALRVVGERAILDASNLERYYRDTPLMIIGEGTNEIQRTIIAKNLVDRYGERAGALASEGGAGEQRQMVLAVRQLVDKEIAPNASDHEQAGHSAVVVLGRVADLGVLAASIPTDEGGLALPPPVCAALLEELARGWASLAAIVASHIIAVRALAGPGALPGTRSLLGDLGRGDMLASTALSGTVTLRRDSGDVVLAGRTALVDGAARADIFVVAATAGDGRRTLVAVPTVTRGLRVGTAEPVLGLRGAEGARVAFDEVRIGPESLLPDSAFKDTLAFAHLATAALGVGLAQASFEAALRYAQQRTAFGKPINQHQAIQLKLADMATAVTATRLLVADADVDPVRAALAKLQATATATRVTLESMRTHGGYGYTAEFTIERHYRDAARLLAMPIPEDETRAAAARALRED
ncbi:MAG TPA: acyl-CoA dehydrogenase family protein, partial [Methylomirabilota bacterium]|nr:acyl-CoA dehydrogenase family protein [Methylomirabilota bacterium]